MSILTACSWVAARRFLFKKKWITPFSKIGKVLWGAVFVGGSLAWWNLLVNSNLVMHTFFGIILVDNLHGSTICFRMFTNEDFIDGAKQRPLALNLALREVELTQSSS